MKHLPDLFRSVPAFSGNPYRDLLSMRRQMDRLMNDLWVDAEPQDFAPACDAVDAGTHAILSFDVPGVKKEDLKIDLQDGVLTVSGDRKDETEEKKKGSYRSERFYGSFQRSFLLPPGVKAEQIETRYADGVLKIAVPKAQAAQTQQVKIGEGKSSLWDRLLGHKKEEPKAEKAA